MFAVERPSPALQAFAAWRLRFLAPRMPQSLGVACSQVRSRMDNASSSPPRTILALYPS